MYTVIPTDKALKFKMLPLGKLDHGGCVSVINMETMSVFRMRTVVVTCSDDLVCVCAF